MKCHILILFVALSSCSEGVISDPDQIVFPTANVSYAQHIAPLMAVSCAFSGCHDAPRTANNNTYFTSWVGMRGVAEPFDTTCSLIRVVYGRQPHWSGALTINRNHQEGMRTWVLEGALNN